MVQYKEHTEKIKMEKISSGYCECGHSHNIRYLKCKKKKKAKNTFWDERKKIWIEIKKFANIEQPVNKWWFPTLRG